MTMETSMDFQKVVCEVSWWMSGSFRDHEYHILAFDIFEPRVGRPKSSATLKFCSHRLGRVGFVTESYHESPGYAGPDFNAHQYLVWSPVNVVVRSGEVRVGKGKSAGPGGLFRGYFRRVTPKTGPYPRPSNHFYPGSNPKA